ncbi:MAG TPA: hypothetical protein VNO53_09745 [Steroidobacteraceae bacterium]|nr:hypothetical protein [Steroidobacteraceae bacterium]
MELQTVSDVREFFRDALQSALGHQHLHVQDHTEHYIVNLLAMFAHTDALFDPDEKRSQPKPLALLLAEAVNAPDDRQRFRMLQRLGDVALFVAGFLAGGSSRRPVGVDYHIAMGGRAYGTLAQASCHGGQRVLGGVFAELGIKFQPLVDALNEIGEDAAKNSPRDMLRLYELWHRTGSPRAHRLLLKLGIQPVAAGTFAN